MLLSISKYNFNIHRSSLLEIFKFVLLQEIGGFLSCIFIMAVSQCSVPFPVVFGTIGGDSDVFGLDISSPVAAGARERARAVAAHSTPAPTDMQISATEIVNRSVSDSVMRS